MIDMKQISSFINNNYRCPDLKEIKNTLRRREIEQIDTNLKIKAKKSSDGLINLTKGFSFQFKKDNKESFNINEMQQLNKPSPIKPKKTQKELDRFLRIKVEVDNNWLTPPDSNHLSNNIDHRAAIKQQQQRDQISSKYSE